MTERAGRCVMVVEDDEDVRTMLAAVLEDAGYATLLAEDGDAALDALRADPERVSLVIVDLMMPRLGGAGFLRRKATEPSFASLPVVIVSAIPDLTPIPDTEDVKAVLRKPVGTDELLAEVRRWT